MGSGISSPVAIVRFRALATGADALVLEWAGAWWYVDEWNASASVDCYDAGGYDTDLCFDGESENVLPTPTNTPTLTPTPTATPTPTPTATPTPGGAVGGIAEPPDIESGAAASGPGASVAGAVAAVTAGAGLLVLAGAWYARRRRRAG